MRKQWHDILIQTGVAQCKRKMKTSVPAYCCLMIGYQYFGGTFFKRTKYLPKASSTFAKCMGSKNPCIAETRKSYSKDDEQFSASLCNDLFRLTFKQIAMLVYPEQYNKVEFNI